MSNRCSVGKPYAWTLLSERMREFMGLHLSLVGRMPAKWLVGNGSQLESRARYPETGRPTITTIVGPAHLTKKR